MHQEFNGRQYGILNIRPNNILNNRILLIDTKLFIEFFPTTARYFTVNSRGIVEAEDFKIVGHLPQKLKVGGGNK